MMNFQIQNLPLTLFYHKITVKRRMQKKEKRSLAVPD